MEAEKIIPKECIETSAVHALRYKAGRLQALVEYGWGTLMWRDVPEVPADTPDDEVGG